MRISAVLLGALALASAGGRAATIPAAEDTFSYRAKLTQAANRATSLPVDATHRAFIYFDLSQLPQEASVRYARLRLYLPSVTRAGAGLDVHKVTGTWDELFASAEPTIDSPAIATLAPAGLLSKRFVSVDVTALVQGWLADPASNEGVAVTTTVGSTTDPKAKVFVGAKEGAGSGYPAELEVELNPLPIGAATIGPAELAPDLNLAGTTTGTFVGDGSGLTNFQATNLSGQISNAQLVNSKITLNLGEGLVGSGEVSLGETLQITNSGVLSVAPGGGVVVSASNGHITLGSTASPMNSPGSIVQRDGSGNFAATTMTGSFVGNGAGLTNVNAANGISVISLANANAAFMEFVRVANPNNPNDGITGSLYGAVSATFLIGKYEVTNEQYARFLNSVAATDLTGLYNPAMGLEGVAGIARSGSPGSYLYAARPKMGNKPVNFVSFFDAIRFCNWLHNGMPIGVQDPTTTEDGAYHITGASPNWVVNARKPGAKAFLPTESEWYKAAHFDPTKGSGGGYWLFATRNDAVPTVAMADDSGNVNNATSNIANYVFGADWNGQNGNLTTVGSGGPGSESYYGAADMSGSVWEWIETIVSGQRQVRGGSYIDTDTYLRSTFRDPNGYGPANEDPNKGFRVARP